MQCDSYVYIPQSIIPLEKQQQCKPTDYIAAFLKNHPTGFESESFRKAIINIPIHAMIDDWLETQEGVETKRKYRIAINRVFSEAGLLNINCSICSMSDWEGIYQWIENWLAPANTKKICLTAYSKFCDFIRVHTLGVVDSEISLKDQISYKKAKEIWNYLMIEKEGIKLRPFVDALGTPYKTIAKLIFSTAKTYCYRLRISDKHNNILSLKTSQVDINNNTVFFDKSQTYHVMGLKLEMSPFDETWQELRNLAKNKSEYIFNSSEGTKLFPRQVERRFHSVCEQLNYPRITPVILAWLGIIAYKKIRTPTNTPLIT